MRGSFHIGIQCMYRILKCSILLGNYKSPYLRIKAYGKDSHQHIVVCDGTNIRMSTYDNRGFISETRIINQSYKLIKSLSIDELLNRISFSILVP